jgi:hypothetical protein
MLAFWRADAGVWVAQAVLVTLVTRGLVARGQAAGQQRRPCWRLCADPVQGRGVPRPPARDALLQSPRLAALLAGDIPPDWVVVRYDKAAEVAQLLTQLGFAISDGCPLSTSSSG